MSLTFLIVTQQLQHSKESVRLATGIGKSKNWNGSSVLFYQPFISASQGLIAVSTLRCIQENIPLNPVLIRVFSGDFPRFPGSGHYCHVPRLRLESNEGRIPPKFSRSSDNRIWSLVSGSPTAKEWRVFIGAYALVGSLRRLPTRAGCTRKFSISRRITDADEVSATAYTLQPQYRRPIAYNFREGANLAKAKGGDRPTPARRDNVCVHIPEMPTQALGANPVETYFPQMLCGG